MVARRLHHAHMRIQQWDYSLSGLVGFELHGKTVGVVGTGAIGSALCAVLKVCAHTPVHEKLMAMLLRFREALRHRP